MSAYVNMDTLRFQLFNTHQLENLLELPRFADYDTEAIGIMLDAIKDFSDKESH